MAYAEKRGKGPRPWRVKYKLPSGSEASESGFETKQSALDWGRDQEAKIRAGTWTDPNAGKITVNDWIDRWLAVQDVGLSTESNREYLIRRFLRPQWGSRTLDSLTGEEITAWENALPTSLGISRRTARDARSLLCTILGDAAAAKPARSPTTTAMRLRPRAWRHWPIRVLHPGRRPLPPQQLRPAGVPPGLRRALRTGKRQARQPGRGGRHSVAGKTGRVVAAHVAGKTIRAPIRQGNTSSGQRRRYRTLLLLLARDTSPPRRKPRRSQDPRRALRREREATRR